ncbi:C39 family peptidase [Anaerobacillus isosaccharinicus]|uniref:C39 family peptidase n=1 Tax=Anaerobacillus isosaccharinicus TaxID=1532552 RepID=A0A7S7L9P7_9BACI|nr:C39 family peptidase [Anaerobacillus isosaccharinicus]MBA5584634.1 C39 family peptidase [Anaerobacillus isosaccharinicus]QOY36991.1 C39 family peptidase [Anaerobacillus isosaccharinicus]
MLKAIEANIILQEKLSSFNNNIEKIKELFMETMIAGIVAIFIVITIALFAIAKVLNAQKLFVKGFFSFIIIVAAFGGLTYTFLGFDFKKQLHAEGNVAEEGDFPNETPFAVVGHDAVVSYFKSYPEAIDFAKHQGGQLPVYFRDHETIVWEKTSGIPARILQVPLILQLPELERGAEITSLAMMLNFSGENVHKLELAERVTKDHTPFAVEAETIFFGNPNDGFVGNVYSASSPGLGVHHQPIRKLAEIYLPEKIVDMTGASFEDILYPIHQGQPVWTIIHTQFKTLPGNAFQTWVTPTGEIEVTQYQHSVLITGYDEKNVYYNDPMSQEVNRPISINQFKAAWVQMGSQAISYSK